MKVREVETSVYKISTDQPEADGTLSWDATTIMLVSAQAENGVPGLGYTCAHHYLINA